ncbi:MAG: AraC family transcriptional regulator [Oscillospiraceae bacterium]|nr:AraC family transcriptional regulator [Oscillospiraceae bacterium]
MDWLKGMNNVVEHIEENLTQTIRYDTLSQIVGCSVYEFSRIFSFMTGMSVSEYIRRRRLSQAVFDIQNSNEKIIDIALKYCYESPTTFTRAFKELHGTAPLAVRKSGVTLKTYPPISFKLTIKGVGEMKHRIEKRGVMGLKIDRIVTPMFEQLPKPLEVNFDRPPINMHILKWSRDVIKFNKEDADHSVEILEEMKKDAKSLGYGDDWERWRAEKVGNVVLIDQGNVDLPLYDANGSFIEPSNRFRMFMGRIGEDTELKIPAATWAVFTYDTEMTEQNLSEAYTRILTEWMPISGYKRDTSVPHMEQYQGESDTWEIWLPVVVG